MHLNDSSQSEVLRQVSADENTLRFMAVASP